jgi:hypothetical protein
MEQAFTGNICVVVWRLFEESIVPLPQLCAFIHNQLKELTTKVQTLIVVWYHQEQSWNGTRIKEEPKDEETEEPHVRCLDGWVMIVDFIVMLSKAFVVTFCGQ